LTPERVRGKVVLLRWWTEGCPLCATTLPALEKLRAEHRDDLVVIGVFHPKPRRHVSDREILKTADKLGFKGPIAVDERWSTLGLVAARLAPGAAIAKSAPPPAPPHATAIARAEDLDAMRAAFNASADSLRIVLLLSPSSGDCVNAAAAVESLLERHPQAQAV